MLNSARHQIIYEVKDTKRNRDDVIRAYGLMNYAPEATAHERATELINKFTKLSPLIDPSHDYFGSPPTGKTYNPTDIFSWARVAKDTKDGELVGLQQLEAMLANLSRIETKKTVTKASDKDYEVLHDSPEATLYRPRSEASSCRLGAGTKWCTAGRENNMFDSYKADGVVLFYAVTKSPKNKFQPEEKYAVAMYPGGEIFKVFDAEDNEMSWEEWTDLANYLGLPTDKEFYRAHGPAPIDLLKKKVTHASTIISGSARPAVDGPSSADLLKDVLDSVSIIHRGKDQEQLAALVKYREDEGQPDGAFLMDVYDSSSIEYFLDRKFNPPNSNNWANGQFQEEMARNIRRLSTVTKLVNAPGSHNPAREFDAKAEMNGLTQQVYGPPDGDTARNVFYQLRLYIKHHMDDKWPEVEKALIDLWLTNHSSTNIKSRFYRSEHSETPMSQSMMWARTVFEYRAGKWEEFEEALHRRIKHVLHSSPDDLNLIAGLISMGENFNRMSNHEKRLSKTEARAFVPQSEEHLKRYADGEWDIEGPPLLHVS